MNQKILISVLVVAVLILGGTTVYFLTAQKSVAPVVQTPTKPAPVQKEYTNSIQFSSVGINPIVRDKIDYSSLQFTFGATSSSKQNLINVSSVDFYDRNGVLLGSIPKEKFIINTEAETPVDNLTGTIPLSVGNYLKGKNNESIKYELSDGGKIFFNDTLLKSDPYRLTLEKTSPAPEFGISTRISLDSMLIPRECALYNEKGKKILEMEPKNVSNPSLLIKDIPKITISVYAICYLSDGSTVKTEALSL